MIQTIIISKDKFYPEEVLSNTINGTLMPEHNEINDIANHSFHNLQEFTSL